MCCHNTEFFEALHHGASESYCTFLLPDATGSYREKTLTTKKKRKGRFCKCSEDAGAEACTASAAKKCEPWPGASSVQCEGLISCPCPAYILPRSCSWSLVLPGTLNAMFAETLCPSPEPPSASPRDQARGHTGLTHTLRGAQKHTAPSNGARPPLRHEPTPLALLAFISGAV